MKSVLYRLGEQPDKTSSHSPERRKGETVSGSVVSDAMCDPVDSSLPGSSVHGILQSRILEWVAIPFSRGWIFLTQGSNLGLLHCTWILHRLSHQESPNTIFSWSEKVKQCFLEQARLL